MIGELTSTPRTRRSALDNRRFRTVLLAIAGIPIVATYLWQALIQPIFLGGYLGDFQESYMRAATRIANGQDPYDLCATIGCLEPTGPQYVMPPVLAWLLQLLVGVDAHLITVGAVVVLNASLGLFVWLTLKALKVDDWQLAVLLVLIALAFEPVVGNVDEGQVNLVLLALSGVWLLAWVDDRWWGGAALGAALLARLLLHRLVGRRLLRGGFATTRAREVAFELVLGEVVLRAARQPAGTRLVIAATGREPVGDRLRELDVRTLVVVAHVSAAPAVERVDRVRKLVAGERQHGFVQLLTPLSRFELLGLHVQHDGLLARVTRPV